MSDETQYTVGDSYAGYVFLGNELSGTQVGVNTLPVSTVTPDDQQGAAGPGLATTGDGSLQRFKGGFGGPDGIVYNTYAGTDIVAQFVLPNESPITLGEVQTLSYSIHRDNIPVRFLGHTSPSAFIHGPRTIGGSMIFTLFNNYAFYRIKQYQEAIGRGLYPLADMLPPFDIVLTFANESGAFSKMKIFGVTIVDEGGTMSVDDLMLEQTYTFMARGIQPMTGYFVTPGSATISRPPVELPRGV